MKKYKVLAQSFSRETGKPTGKPRTETIDPATNVMFKNCKTIMDVKEAYESFWNYLNPKSEDVVFVQKITVK